MKKIVLIVVMLVSCFLTTPSIPTAYAAGEMHVEFDSCHPRDSISRITDPRGDAIKDVWIKYEEWHSKWDGIVDVFSHSLSLDATTIHFSRTYCAHLTVMFRKVEADRK